MALDIGTLQATIGADTSQLKKADREVSRVSSGMSTAFKRLGAVIATALSFEAARRIIMIADNLRVLERRLVRFTGSAQSAEKTMASLMKTASDTGSQIQSTVGTFERFALVKDDIGATNEEIIQLTDTVTKLGALGGSAQAEISNALRQMSQSFAGGVVRAEEFNSIIENTPEIIKAIAREMDVSMGDLRQQMLEGELTAKQVFNAMLAASEQTNEEFEAMPKSIDMVVQALQNELSVAIGQADDGLGFSAAISTAIEGLTDMVEKINEATEAQRRLNEMTGADRPASERTPEQREAKEMNDLLEERERLIRRVGELTDKPVFGGFIQSAIGGEARQRELQQAKRDLAEVEALVEQFRRNSRAAARVEETRAGGQVDQLGQVTVDAERIEQGGGSDAAQKRIAALRQLGETEREEINRIARERREFLKQQDQLTADERFELAAKIEQDRQAQLAELGERELEQIRQLNETEREEIERIAQERREFLLTQEQLTADELAELREKISQDKQAQLEALAEREKQAEMRKEQERADALTDTVNQTSNAISNVLQATGDSTAGKIASIINQVASLASTIVSISAAQAQAQAAADPTAITTVQKIANIATMAAQFAGIFAALDSATGGGRQFGGPTSPSLAHPINEGGTPEILQQGSKQFLLPNGRGGTVSPLKEERSSGQANITIISNGTPQTVTGTQVTRDEVVVMINDATNRTEQRVNSSLASGRGDTARSMQKGFKVERNL